MFGNPSLAAWGTSQWGDILVDPGAVFVLDAVVQGDRDASFALESSAGLINEDRTVALDAVVQGDQEAQFTLDYAPISLPVGIYNVEDLVPYILVELQLPAGTVRVSGRCFVALGSPWDARLINAGDVLRTIGAGTDDLQIALDDTDTDGQARFRDLFAANDPEGSVVNVWLGADGLADSDHLLVFQGKIEEVVAFTYTEVRLRILRREAVEDRMIGRLLDQASNPNAPPDSIGRMVPIVFGSVEAHEGLVTDTLELATLQQNVFASDTNALPIGDASRFPISGTVEIDNEQILYGSKNNSELLFLTRGANGTLATDHAKGTEVREVGTFVVRFADHTLASIARIRLLLPSGNLGEPVPGPAAISNIAATATWNEIPKIRDPEAPAVYQRVHFNVIDPLNTAGNPQFAARENIGYEAFQTATLLSGQQLVLQTNVDDLGEPGDIQRVWLGVVFDPKGAVDRPIPSTVARIGAGSLVTFRLQPTDIVPEVIARHDEKTGDRFYDVPPPVADVTAPAEQPFSVTPEVVVHPGIWATQGRAKVVVDKDEDTCVAYAFIGVGEVQLIGAADAIFRLADDTSVLDKLGVAGSEIATAQLVFVAGWEQTPFSSTFDIFLRKDGKEIPGTRFKASTLAPSGLPAGLINGKDRFVHPISPATAALIDDKTEWVVHPSFGVSNGLWVGCELLLEGTFQPPAPEVNIQQDTRNTVTNYFEVTDQLGKQVSPGGGAVVLDWGWFSDLQQGGQVTFATFGLPNEQARIVEAFFVVEYRPYVEAGTQQPRVFADVTGLNALSNPADLFRLLVTAPSPFGLGLPITRIDQAAYQAARTGYLNDGVRADFAVREQRSILGLLPELAAQVDSRETWENSVHRVLRLPRADTSLPVTLTLQDGDLLRERPIKIKRSPRARIVNKATLKWKPYAPNNNETSQTATLDDAGSQAAFGVQESIFELTLITSSVTANLVGTRKLERLRVPRWVVEFEMPLYGLNLRLGDLVAMAHRDFDFEVGEVTQLNLATAGFKKVRVQIAVWKK